MSELLTLLRERRRTCVVHVTDGEHSGELCLVRGELHFVRFGEAIGATALLTVLTADDVHYSLDARERSAETPVPAASGRAETRGDAAIFGAPALDDDGELVTEAVAPEGAVVPRSSEDPQQTLAVEEQGRRSYLEVVADHPTAEHGPHLHEDVQYEGIPPALYAMEPMRNPEPPSAAGEGLGEAQLGEPQLATGTDARGDDTSPGVVHDCLPDPAPQVADRADGTREALRTSEPPPLATSPRATDARPGERSALPPSLAVTPASRLQSNVPATTLLTIPRPKLDANASATSKADNGGGKAEGPDAAQAGEPPLAPVPPSVPPRYSRPVQSLSSLIPPPPPARKLPSWRWMAAGAALVALFTVLVFRPTAGSKSGSEAPKPPVGATEPVALVAGEPPVAPDGALVPTVLVGVHVKSDGSVGEVHVHNARADLSRYEEQAVAAVRRYRFKAALRAGKAVDGWITLPITFVPAPVQHQIAIKGSDTLGAALAPAWGRAFEAEQGAAKVSVEALGTSTGIAGLLDGSAQIATASRRVTAEELASAAKLGVQLRELVAGYDGVAVIANRANALKQLDLEAIGKVFAQRVSRWSELGGRESPIHVFGRPSYSGTHAFFREKVLGALGSDVAFGATVQSLESSSEIVSRVAADPQAIGYVGLGHVNSSVQVLAIAPNRNAPAIAPTVATVQAGRYPLARPLLLYLRADAARDVRAFADFTLAAEGQRLLAESGFVPLAAPVATSLAAERDRPHAPSSLVMRIYFEPGSASLAPESRLDLLAAGATMRAARSALVIGNADASGDGERNRALAGKRANAVATELARHAAADAPIDVTVSSSERPLATNETADGRRANRRVDVVLVAR